MVKCIVMSKNRNPENERAVLQAIDLNGEERFMMVVVDVVATAIRETNGPLTEAEVKEGFKSSGMPPPEIDARIATAREKAAATA